MVLWFDCSEAAPLATTNKSIIKNMLNLDRIQNKIVSHVFFDLLLCIIQATLLLSVYLGNKLDFQYVYFGTLVLSAIIIFRLLFLVILMTKSIWAKRYFLSLGLVLYILVFAGLWLSILVGGLFPITGVSSR